MNLTTNFQLEELVHPDIYEKCGDRSADFLHPMLAPTVQDIRDEFGRLIINDWLWGGRFESSGLRLPHGTVGAMLSAHKFGTAADLKFDDADPQQVQSYILTNIDKWPHITRMENAKKTKTWLHLEVGQRTSNDIYVFNP